ncbi:TetR family transcriptional regulator [Oribacterium sp. oral taxon 108]|uniref:TetR family transcriptional regulator n=1 Tax=Oribacterium sp. oral taxon 108 TaxID=712414 RepID=UPI00020DD467|nr:TetR family transcriptional regulator [Oribacterium sp. oral taxon 108]EGL36843.1 transcriptional regulator, TetR family [Oribacterium sp. oral taxon 108 str. F0425]
MKNCELRERTKEKLATALISAMEEKALDKITVKEIIEKAEVNRKTFYYYFPDIYGLLEWVISRESNKLITEIQNNRDYENALNDVLDSIEKHRHLLNCIKDSVGRVTLERVLYRELEQLASWAMKIGICETGVAISEKELQILTELSISDIWRLLLLYFQKEISYKRDEFIQFILRYLKASITAGLMEFGERDLARYASDTR